MEFPSASNAVWKKRILNSQDNVHMSLALF